MTDKILISTIRPVRWKKTNQKYAFYGIYIKIWNIINNDNTYIVSHIFSIAR